MPAPPPSSVTPEFVRRVAELARLRVPENELPHLTAQLARIVAYIDQIREIPPGVFPESAPVVPTPVRPDVAIMGPGARALEANAPAIRHGHGAVPRVVGAIE